MRVVVVVVVQNVGVLLFYEVKWTVFVIDRHDVMIDYLDEKDDHLLHLTD